MNNIDLLSRAQSGFVNQKDLGKVMSEFLSLSAAKTLEQISTLVNIEFETMDYSEAISKINAVIPSDATYISTNGRIYSMRNVATMLYAHEAGLSGEVNPLVNGGSNYTPLTSDNVVEDIEKISESASEMQVYATCLRSLRQTNSQTLAVLNASLSDAQKNTIAGQQVLQMITSNASESLASTTVSDIISAIKSRSSFDVNGESDAVYVEYAFDADDYQGMYGFNAVLADVCSHIDLSGFIPAVKSIIEGFAAALNAVLNLIISAAVNVISSLIEWLFVPLVAPAIFAKVNGTTGDGTVDISYTCRKFSLDSLTHYGNYLMSEFQYAENKYDEYGDFTPVLHTISTDEEVRDYIQSFTNVSLEEALEQAIPIGSLRGIPCKGGVTLYGYDGEFIYMYEFIKPLGMNINSSIFPDTYNAPNATTITNGVTLETLVEILSTYGTIDTADDVSSDDIANGFFGGALMIGFYRYLRKAALLTVNSGFEDTDELSYIGNKTNFNLNNNIFLRAENNLDFPSIIGPVLNSEYDKQVDIDPIHGWVPVDIMDGTTSVSNNDIVSVCDGTMRQDPINPYVLADIVFMLCDARPDWNANYSIKYLNGLSLIPVSSTAWTYPTPSYKVLTDSDIVANIKGHLGKIAITTLAVGAGIAYFTKVLPACRRAVISNGYAIKGLDVQLSNAAASGLEITGLLKSRKAAQIRYRIAVALGGAIMNPYAANVITNAQNDLVQHGLTKGELEPLFNDVERLIH